MTPPESDWDHGLEGFAEEPPATRTRPEAPGAPTASGPVRTTAEHDTPAQDTVFAPQTLTDLDDLDGSEGDPDGEGEVYGLADDTDSGWGAPAGPATLDERFPSSRPDLVLPGLGVVALVLVLAVGGWALGLMAAGWIVWIYRKDVPVGSPPRTGFDYLYLPVGLFLSGGVLLLLGMPALLVAIIAGVVWWYAPVALKNQ